MNNKTLRGLWMIAALLAMGSFSPARAVTMYGALSNFDAINDTGVTAHGFEIELEGCNPADVSYTFGAPYNRYGDPTIIASLTGGTIVRYASSYDSGTQIWAAGTVTGTLSDTGGHSLFNGSYPGYPGTVPGDHFGIGLNVNPTNTIYRWLVEDLSSPGNLTYSGTNVKIPAPVLTLQQPVNPADPHVIQAAVQAPPNDDPENHLFGEAIWAKVFTIEVQNPEPVKLEDLVLGNAAVPPETEIEIEWQLLQDGNAGFDARGDNVNVGEGNESVTRRYEFYKYLGDLSDRDLYDEWGEALIEDPTTPEAMALNGGLGVVGDFLGGQNVAVNLLVPEPGTLALLGMGMAGIARFRGRARSGGSTCSGYAPPHGV